MFEHLMDLSLQRTRKQAVGFYLATVLLGAIITAIVVYFFMRATGMHMPAKGDFAAAVNMVKELKNITVPVVFVISTLLSILMAWKKRAYNKTAILCIGLAAVLSFGGAIFSFAPVAYLTTLPKKDSQP